MKDIVLKHMVFEVSMRKLSFLFIAVVLYAFSASACMAAPAVVSVDLQRIVAESEPGKQAAMHLEKVRQVLQKGFDDLRKAHEKDSEEERNKIYAEGLSVLNRQMEIERQSAMRAVNAVVVDEIEKWRKKNGVQLVIPRSMVIAGDFNKADYTNTIMSAVNKRTVKFAELPKVTIKDTKKK